MNYLYDIANQINYKDNKFLYMSIVCEININKIKMLTKFDERRMIERVD